MQRELTLQINGKAVRLTTEDARPLLEVLREDLGMTGTKYGCGEGVCGACTVLLDARPARSCVTPVGEVGERKIETIEGLADSQLHPVQRAFLEEQAMQCGYCVPGQILSAVALLRANPNPSSAQILAAMNGNICRCCHYKNILAAVAHAAQGE